VKNLLRRALARIEERFFGPVHSRLERVEKSLEGADSRLAVVESHIEELIRRMDEVQEVVETTMARVAASTERSLIVAESQARTERRVEEIERLLGAPSSRSAGRH